MTYMQCYHWYYYRDNKEAKLEYERQRRNKPEYKAYDKLRYKDRVRYFKKYYQMITKPKQQAKREYDKEVQSIMDLADDFNNTPF